VPELPEVETVRRGLEQWAVGRQISDVEIRGPRTVRWHVAGPKDFVAQLCGRTITAACRRGKYLWLTLDEAGERGWGPATSAEGAGHTGERGWGPATSAEGTGHTGERGWGPATSAEGACMTAHLGMSGQFLAVPAGTPDQPHLRARFTFDDGDPEIRFVDQRTFGGLALDELVDVDGAALPSAVSHIARDPVDPAFDRAAFMRQLRRRRTGIKRALLDQSLISGVGNIYADEALWRARLHYDRPTDALRRADVERLLDAVDEVLADAIRAGGTSFDALYVAVNGESGWFDRSLEAYGREGEPCSRCGRPIRREAFMNRSSYRCPRCQPRPRGGGR
jgi:formamidopyrimidine-DNA glycosylase